MHDTPLDGQEEKLAGQTEILDVETEIVEEGGAEAGPLIIGDMKKEEPSV